MKRIWKRRTKEVETFEAVDPRLIGYASVSTREQNLDLQIDALTKAGVMTDDLYVEKISGASTKRPQLKMALTACRPGDTLLVWKIDRLGRGAEDLFRIVRELRQEGVGFKTVSDGYDFTGPMGQLLFGMLALVAQFERDLTIARTKAGMRAAADRGRKAGRAPKMTQDKLTEAARMLRTDTVAEVAKHFGVSGPTIRTYFDSATLERLRYMNDRQFARFMSEET